jgi:glycine oxidase
LSEFVVIGGGIIGLLTALELADTGADVTLLEKGETGSEASWAGGGILSPLYPWRYPDPITQLASWSQQRYPELCERLHQLTGVDPEYTTNGLLILDTEEVDTARRWAADHGSTLQRVESDTITRLEPGLGRVPESAIWLPKVGQVRSPRLIRAERLALAKSVHVAERSEVLELLVKGDKAIGARTPRTTHHAENTIVCAGAWTAQLLAQLGSAPKIEPVRGQMILFNAKPGDVQRIVLHKDRYAIPRRDGRVLMGSTLEHSGFEKETTEQARDELYRRALELFPSLGQAPIEKHWAGLRPSSPSGIPYIGAYPGIQGLYFNSGHFRNGVVLGPASARLMADIALGRKPIVPPAPFALDAPRGN